ncbi:MAG: PAS domain S-box protein [Theionarchaea archaeon]|nr:PAS domain S-box protein [Theionarchaea archaeon]
MKFALILLLELIGLSAQSIAFFFRWNIVKALGIENEFRNFFYLVIGVVFMNFIPFLISDDLLPYLPLLGFTYGLFCSIILLKPPFKHLKNEERETMALSHWKATNSLRHYGYLGAVSALILSIPFAILYEDTVLSQIPLFIWSFSFIVAAFVERSIWIKINHEQVSALENPPHLTVEGTLPILEANGYFTQSCINQILYDLNPKIIRAVFNEACEELPFIFSREVLGEDGTFSVDSLLKQTDQFQGEHVGYVCRSFGYLNRKLLETYSRHTAMRYALEKFNRCYKDTKERFSSSDHFNEFICSLPDGVGDEDKIELVGQEEFQKIYLKKTAELLESKDRYRVLFFYAIDPIFTHDAQFTVLDINPSGCDLFGEEESDIIGKSILDLNVFHHDDKRVFEDNMKKIISGEVRSLTDSYRFKGSDDHYRTFEITSTGLPSEVELTVITNVCRDITERIEAEEQIIASLQEKEVLLKEIHHRVKNNMQVISSLLNLQSGYIPDESMQEIFKESQNRIKSMALVHEKLYQSRDFTKIDLNEYVRTLVRDLIRSYGQKAGNIMVTIDVETVYLEVDMAIPCGLIINELVSNSLRHGFPGDRRGELHISLHSVGNTLTLVVKDNGVGFPPGFNYRDTESLGLRLVTILAEDQLHGRIELNQSEGTQFCIMFEEP